MTDTNIQLPALDTAGAVDDSDLYHVRQGNKDSKITFAAIKAGISATEVGAISDNAVINTTAPLQGGGTLANGLTLSLDSATETTAGAVELASGSGTIAGEDGTRAVTPAGIAALTATQSRRGLVQGATDAIAAVGTNTDLFINSKQLKAGIDSIPSASTTVEGKLRVATVTEAQEQTADNVALSPLKLAEAFTGSKTTDGYMYLPNGWIIQWMQGPSRKSNNDTRVVNWPVAFPNGVLHINMSWKGIASGAKANQTAYPSSWNNTSITVVYDSMGANGNITPLIFAIGH